ncbi:MAG: tetratricopeptide repeat protein, partial [Acidobacteriota bacterium]
EQIHAGSWPHNPPLAHRTLTMAGFAHSRIGNLVDAEQSFKLALRQVESIHGAEQPQAIRPSMYLALVYMQESRWEEAEARLNEAFRIRQNRTHFIDARATGSLLGLRANLSYSRGRFEEAERRYQDLLDFQSSQIGPMAPEMVGSYNALGAIAVQTKRFDVAAERFQKAIAIGKETNQDSLQTADAWNNFGVVRYRQGRLEEALECYREALELKNQILGPGSASAATTIANIADTHVELGRLEEAEALYLEAIAIIGEGNAALKGGNANRGYAVLLALTDRPDAAEHRFKKALDIWAGLEADHPELIRTRREYADFLRDQGRRAEAEEVLSKIPESASD